MVTVETISIVFTGVSISLAAFYYISTLRNTRMNQELQLETRQIQLYMQLLDRFASEENRLRSIEVGQQEFDDFEDFHRKLRMNVNPEAAAKRLHVMTELEGIGHLLSRGLIDMDFIPPIIMGITKNFWEKWGPIEVEQRRIRNNPRRSEYVEYLYNEVVKYMEEHPELKT